jgi:hypothetical protein
MTNQDFSIRPYRRDTADEWDRFVDACDEAWLYHLSDFVEEGTGSGLQNDRSFSVWKNDEIVAVCALRVIRREKAKLLAGPGVAAKTSDKKLRKFCYATIEGIAAKEGCAAVRLQRSSLAPAFHEAQYVNSDLMELGYNLGFWGEHQNFEVGCWIIADLRRSPQEVLGSFTKGNKASVRKCQREGVTATWIDLTNVSDSAWREFETIYAWTMARGGGGVMGAERAALLRAQIARGRALMISTHLGGECLTSAIMLTYKGSAYYEAGASSARGVELDAMVFTLFTTLCDLPARRLTHLNLGPYVPSHLGTKWGAICEFKRRFGTQHWDLLVVERVLDRNRYWWSLMTPLALKRQLLNAKSDRRMSFLLDAAVGVRRAGRSGGALLRSLVARKGKDK